MRILDCLPSPTPKFCIGLHNPLSVPKEGLSDGKVLSWSPRRTTTSILYTIPRKAMCTPGLASVTRQALFHCGCDCMVDAQQNPDFHWQHAFSRVPSRLYCYLQGHQRSATDPTLHVKLCLALLGTNGANLGTDGGLLESHSCRSSIYRRHRCSARLPRNSRSSASWWRGI